MIAERKCANLYYYLIYYCSLSPNIILQIQILIPQVWIPAGIFRKQFSCLCCAPSIYPSKYAQLKATIQVFQKLLAAYTVKRKEKEHTCLNVGIGDSCFNIKDIITKNAQTFFF